MRCFIFAAALALAAGAANALTVEFSFSNEDGNVDGTVVGQFDIADTFDFTTITRFPLTNLRLVSVPDVFGTPTATYRCVRLCGYYAPPQAPSPVTWTEVSGTYHPTLADMTLATTEWSGWHRQNREESIGTGTYYDPAEGFVLRYTGQYFRIGAGPDLDFGSVWMGVALETRYRLSEHGGIAYDIRPFSDLIGGKYTSALSLSTDGYSVSDVDQSTLSFRIVGAEDDLPAVPLPSAALLLIAGLGCLPLARRRRG